MASSSQPYVDATQQGQGNAVQTWLSNAKGAPEWPYILTDLLLKVRSDGHLFGEGPSWVAYALQACTVQEEPSNR